MAKEIKKKDVLPIPIAGDGTIPNDVYSLEQERQEQEKQEQEPIISTQPVEISDQERVPYSEFGGLSQALEVRKQRAAQRKEEALRDWNKALEEQQSARVALVNAARPRDTSTEQRKLRNLAYGQAIGEFLGSLFGGIYGLGSSSGRGYVAKMPGMYAGTMKRIQELEDNDIIAGEKFRNLMASIRERNASDRAAAAQAGYEAADKDDRAADELLYKALLSSRQARDRAALAEQQAEWRRDLAEYNAGQRKEIARIQASGKQQGNGDATFLSMLARPGEKRVRRVSPNMWTGKPEESITYEPYYSKEQRARDVEESKFYRRLANEFGFTDPAVKEIIDALYETGSRDKVPLPWIYEMAQNGISAEEIAFVIREHYGSTNTPSGTNKPQNPDYTPRYIYRDQN